MRYCGQAEAHVFALSAAASALLSFYPFLIVIVSLCKYASRWPAAVSAIDYPRNDYSSGKVGLYIGRNLDSQWRHRADRSSAQPRLGRGKTGLNLENQILNLGSTLLCGVVLSSFLFTALNHEFLKGARGLRFLPAWIAWTMFKPAAVAITILALFLICWLLPNCKVPPGAIARTAIAIGHGLEFLKHINTLAWPLQSEVAKGVRAFLYFSKHCLAQFRSGHDRTRRGAVGIQSPKNC